MKEYKKQEKNNLELKVWDKGYVSITLLSVLQISAWTVAKTCCTNMIRELPDGVIAVSEHKNE